MSQHDAWNNQLVRFDIDTNRWSSIKCAGSTPSPRAAAAAIALSDRNEIILFGGKTRDRGLNDLYLLDMTSFIWTKMFVYFYIIYYSIFSSVISNRRRLHGRSWMNLSQIDASRLVLYGGYSNDNSPCSRETIVRIFIKRCFCCLDDAWLLILLIHSRGNRCPIICMVSHTTDMVSRVRLLMVTFMCMAVLEMIYLVKMFKL